MSEHPSLADLDARIDVRVDDLIKTRADWPCKRGCDQCCHRLAEPPMLLQAEWDRIVTAVGQLPDLVREQAVGRAMKVVPEYEQSREHVTCPFLNQEQGACLIYDARPIACRTYGFYVGRTGDRACEIVTDAIGDDPNIIWGSHDSIERSCQQLGDRISFAEGAKQLHRFDRAQR